jgi:hypothetical protein
MSDIFTSPFETRTGRPVEQIYTDKPAGLLDVGVASFMTEIEPKLDYYSKELGIPRENIGVVDGNIVYRDPQTGKMQSVESGFTRGIVKGTAEAFPAMTGLLGTALTLPTASPPLIAAGGTLGAMGGQSLREAFTGTALEPSGVSRIGFTGAFDLSLALAGSLIAKGLTKAASTEAATMLKRELSSGTKTAADALAKVLSEINQKYNTNIILTPAELTGSAGLRAQQVALGNLPQTSEPMASFAAQRGEEALKAQAGLMEEIAPIFRGADVAGEEITGASKSALDLLSKQRTAAGKPYYESAFYRPVFDSQGQEIAQQPVVVSIKEFDDQITKLIDDMPVIAAPLRRIKQAYSKRGTDLDLEFVQKNIKEVLDYTIENTKTPTGATAPSLVELKNTLIKSLDTQAPQYALARDMWAEMSSPITMAQGGALPALAKAKPKDFYLSGRRFLLGTSPEATKQARNLILKTPDGKRKWDAFIRGGLENIWDVSLNQTRTALSRPEMQAAKAATSYWQTLKGNTSNYKTLKEALDPQQFKALDNLLDVFSATGRAVNLNSTTAGQKEALDALKTLGLSGEILRLIPAPYRALGAASDAVERSLVNKTLDDIMSVITNKGSVEELAKITAGTRGIINQKNMAIVSKAVEGALRGTAGAMYSPSDIPIETDLKKTMETNDDKTNGYVSPFDRF